MSLGARLTRGISPNWQLLVVGNRLHAGDGVMTRLGRHTATPLEHLAVAVLELQVIQAKPSYRFVSERAQRTNPKGGSHRV